MALQILHDLDEHLSIMFERGELKSGAYHYLRHFVADWRVKVVEYERGDP